MVVVSTGTVEPRGQLETSAPREELTETRMTVMHHHVAPECSCSVVVDAASSVSDIAHDDTLCTAEPLDNVDD